MVVQATLKRIRFPKWLLILAILAIAAAVAIPLALTSGGSASDQGDSVDTIRETSNSAPASAPPASVSTEKNSALPSTQETAPATEQESAVAQENPLAKQETDISAPASAPGSEVTFPSSNQEAVFAQQPVFLPVGTVADHPFIGFGNYTPQTLETEYRGIDQIEEVLNGGLITATVIFLVEKIKDDAIWHADRLTEESSFIGNPAVLRVLGRQFDQNRAPLRTVTIEASKNNKPTTSPSQGIWMCATTHQGWTQEQTQQHQYDIQGIYGSDSAKGWTLISIVLGC